MNGLHGRCDCCKRETTLRRESPGHCLEICYGCTEHLAGGSVDYHPDFPCVPGTPKAWLPASGIDANPLQKTPRHKAPPQPHCRACGRDNPDTSEGYTFCCNKPVCYGGRPGMDHRVGCPKVAK